MATNDRPMTPPDAVQPGLRERLEAVVRSVSDAADDYRFVIPQFHAQNRKRMKALATTLDDAMAELAALAQSLPAGGWLPIESAPTNVDETTRCGRPLLLAEGDYVTEGFYHDGSHCYGHRGKAGWFSMEDWGEDRLLTASNIHPDHWMEKPAAPAPQTESRDE